MEPLVCDKFADAEFLLVLTAARADLSADTFLRVVRPTHGGVCDWSHDLSGAPFPANQSETATEYLVSDVAHT